MNATRIEGRRGWTNVGDAGTSDPFGPAPMNGLSTRLQFTRHANDRLQQRGFRSKDVELVMTCGTEGPAGRVVLLSRDVAREVAACKRRIQMLERLRGCVVVCDEGTVVTCYHADGPAGRRTLRDGGKRRRSRNRQPDRARPERWPWRMPRTAVCICDTPRRPSRVSR